MSMSLYVTFHGGSPSKEVPNPLWYVGSYTQSGSTWKFNPNVFNLPAPADKVNELRDIQLGSDGNFYVVNSYKKANVIWRIPPGGVNNQAPAVFTGGSVVPAIFHPFSFAFDSTRTYCYISSQDTNVVTRVFGSGGYVGKAAPVNTALKGSNFLDGTFVASQQGFLPPPFLPSGVSDKAGGLGFSMESTSQDPYPSHSVRGVALIGGSLYVADEAANCVRIYDTTSGAYKGTISDQKQHIQGPVHLLAVGTTLYMTSSIHKGSVLAYDTVNGGDPKTVVEGVDKPSGITLDNAGHFYVASRTKNFVNMYTISQPLSPFTPAAGNPIIKSMTDNPEFLLWVND
jgi:hypothetical protein